MTHECSVERNSTQYRTYKCTTGFSVVLFNKYRNSMKNIIAHQDKPVLHSFGFIKS